MHGHVGEATRFDSHEVCGVPIQLWRGFPGSHLVDADHPLDHGVETVALEQHGRRGRRTVGHRSHRHAGPVQPFERGTGVALGVEPGKGRKHLHALPGRQHRCNRREGAVGHLTERAVRAAGR
jgi:hypothetical protein